MTIILLGLFLSLLLQLFFFAIAYFFRTDKVTDLSYSLTFFVLALCCWFLSTQSSLFLLLSVAMVMLWSFRLGGYLFIRISVIKKDARFDGLREKFLPFLLFWLLQAVTVWIVLLPLLIATSSPSWDFVPIASRVGFAIWAVGLTIESVADVQKFLFKLNKKNKGKWIDSGLWHWARHPNYFGEMLCWWGVLLFLAPALNQQQLIVALVSPLFISFLLRFVSGVPPLEKKYAEVYKNNTAYAAYKKRTNILLPIPIKIF